MSVEHRRRVFISGPTEADLEKVRLRTIPPVEKPDPEAAKPLRREAVRLMAEGRNAEALALLNKAVANSPGDSNLWVQRADCLDELQDDNEAWKSAQKAVQLDPENANAQNMCGLLRKRKGDLEGAVDHYRTAAELLPGNETIRSNLAAAEKELVEKCMLESDAYATRRVTDDSDEAGIRPVLFRTAQEIELAGDRALAGGDQAYAREYWLRSGQVYWVFGAAPRRLEELGDKFRGIGSDADAVRHWSMAAERYAGWLGQPWAADGRKAIEAVALKLEGVGDAESAAKARRRISERTQPSD